MSTTTEQCLSRTTAETFESLALLFPETTLSDEQRQAALDVAVSVEFRGPQAGRLVLRASENILPSVAANMLGEDERRASSLQRDALGELANVICGNVLPKLHGAQAVFQLNAPQVHDAGTAVSRDEDQPAARTEIGIEAGRVEAVLYFFEPRARSAA